MAYMEKMNKIVLTVESNVFTLWITKTLKKLQTFLQILFFLNLKLNKTIRWVNNIIKHILTWFINLVMLAPSKDYNKYLPVCIFMLKSHVNLSIDSSTVKSNITVVCICLNEDTFSPLLHIVKYTWTNCPSLWVNLCSKCPLPLVRKLLKDSLHNT